MSTHTYQKRPVTPFFPERKLFGWEVKREETDHKKGEKRNFLKTLVCKLNKEAEVRQVG